MKLPNIAVLDAKPLINDNLSLDKLCQLGEVRLFEQTLSETEIIERAQAAEIILVNKVKLNDYHFAQLPRLQYIGVTATGTDNVDIHAATKRGIIVTNVPCYGTDSVAQHVIALLLTHTNQVELHNQSVKRNEWQTQPYFSYWLHSITELTDLTLGLLGFGRVAQKVALIAAALGMQVIAHQPSGIHDPEVRSVSLTELLQQADVLSLHCPFTLATQNIINSNTLQQMKPSSILINTSRGGLIDEKALAQALQQQRITAAYLDVLSTEPPAADNPLLQLKNCIITPHMAWASLTARKRLLNTVCENIIRFLNRQPINVVQAS
ncbi:MULTISPECIES: D-2-hydroxyacid dehydrogenase [Legionella]|uniref:2-hydroxyacid dehydrogenase n=1 Tax=Legionella drozanskii LLAP-1 TaxID=1212489 RepID=A0A0W0SW64_9GAMM|nr:MULTISPECIES: D-2-hydroxyacid dehydrogenase [Legionella]KTC87513.1 2-hydroxyacid dehydrogenase [Legionella drozanskii LLAP-1]PJE10453.1 MAG: glycerate dehydrogenase [Legionella sp.]